MTVHPFAAHWDEAEYFNRVILDQRCLHEQGLRALRLEIFYSDQGRPPAYRLLSLPFFYAFGFSSLTARLVSQGYYWIALGFLWQAMRKIVNLQCAVLTILVVCLSPEIIACTICFGTEFPLLLAIAAMFYFVISCVTRQKPVSSDWIGLGVAIGLGLLSKASFVAVALPLLGVLSLARFSRTWSAPSLSFTCKAGLLGSMIAAPWWWINAKPALAYSHFARDFVRHSLGKPSPATWITWSHNVSLGLLGYGTTLIIAVTLVTWLRVRLSGPTGRFVRVQRTTLAVCASAAFPLMVLQLSGTNHLLRHLVPSVVGVAIAVGVLANVTDCFRSRAFGILCVLTFSAQTLLVTAPAILPDATELDNGITNGRVPWRTMIGIDQWDWHSLRELCRDEGFAEPRVAVLGSGRCYNPPQIRYAWVADGAPAIDVRWLWRYENGPIDWQAVMAAADDCDVVVAAPNYVGETSDKQDRDNQYNAEFVHRMSQNGRFRGPFQLSLGKYQPIEVHVFLKNR